VTVNIRQEAPGKSLSILADLIGRLTYREGWEFVRRPDLDRGQGSVGTTVVIYVDAPNSAHPETVIRVAHYMLVPPASYDERSWRRWLFDQIGLVERHERMEFFQMDGKAVYPPAHGPGNDPYLVLEYGSDEDRRMSFRGVLNPQLWPAPRWGSSSAVPSARRWPRPPAILPWSP
jgi:hypothetical protein